MTIRKKSRAEAELAPPGFPRRKSEETKYGNTYLFDMNTLPSKLCAIEGRDRRFRFLGSLHRHEPESARVARVRVIHH